MAASLTKIVSGQSEVSDALTNSQTVKCPLCDQEFRLGYSDSEWHRLKDWLGIAAAQIRKDHKAKHELVSLTLNWKGVSRR
jgi:hypothetical protein